MARAPSRFPSPTGRRFSRCQWRVRLSAGAAFPQVDGEVSWRREEWTAPVHQFFGTWERRRWISKARAGALRSGALRSSAGSGLHPLTLPPPPPPPRAASPFAAQKARVIIKEFFPDMKVVDYEGITAALPADYSIDGEHFYCRYDLWQDRVSYPYPCKGLANSVAANLIANAACNDVV